MKALHISFHNGCKHEIEHICSKLDISLNFMVFDDGRSEGAQKYNIGKERAYWCWEKYKEYFNSFDIIITSDTAPISRVFLQHNFQKKLVIWVCNRFDYYDSASLDCNFPDQEYYDLIRSAKYRANVTIMGYTPFENYYAKCVKNVDIGDLIVKPIGINLSNHVPTPTQNIPNKSELFLIPQYHNETLMMNLSQKLDSMSIKNYNKRYNGPLDMSEFKGVIHIPYAWSNFALFEGIQNGVVYFIPSKSFILKIREYSNFWFQDNYNATFFREKIDLSEWYCDENSEIFVFFDSWEDLLIKVNTINIEEKKKIIKDFANKHVEKYLAMWKDILYSF